MLEAAQMRVIEQHATIMALQSENRELREDRERLQKENADLKDYLRAAFIDLGILPRSEGEKHAKGGKNTRRPPTGADRG